MMQTQDTYRSRQVTEREGENPSKATQFKSVSSGTQELDGASDVQKNISKIQWLRKNKKYAPGPHNLTEGTQTNTKRKGGQWGLQMNCQKKENPPVTSPKNSLFTSVEKHKLKETCEGGSVRSYMLREPSCTTCWQHVWSNQTADEINSINMLCILQGRNFFKNNWKKYEPCNYRTKETIETSWRLPGNHQLLEKITGIRALKVSQFFEFHCLSVVC